MWDKIQNNYIPSTHLSHIACTCPNGNKLPPAILTAVKAGSRLICLSIFRFALAHCFDANYSDRFHPRADNPTTCLCYHIPRLNPTRTPWAYRHTRNHIIFHCITTQTHHDTHLQNITSLANAFAMQQGTSQLCDFLRASNCTLLRPLPWDTLAHVALPQPDPP
jgi:hypothetical protein